MKKSFVKRILTAALALTMSKMCIRDSHTTAQRLQSNLPVTTHTLDKLCKSLDCRLEDIAEYVPIPNS